MDQQDREDAEEQEKVIQNIKQMHLEEMYVKRREFEEKQHDDIERYVQLERMKAKQLEEFQGKIAELKLLQDRELKDTKVENALVLTQKEQEIKNLELKAKELAQENKKARKAIEDKAWDEIDIIKEQNKKQLAENI